MHSAGEVPLATIASPRDVPVGAAPQPLSTFFGLTLTDPTSVIPQNGSLFARLCNGLILDPRDRPFIALSLQASIVIVPFAAFLFWPGAFNWWLGGVYLMLNFGFFVDRYVLMLHNTCHRPLFRRRYKFLNFYIPNFLGPFFGETPNTYLCHHLGMHHPENNLPGDLSSTMRFDRDNVLHFCVYFARFFFSSLVELSLYLWRKKRKKLLRRAVLGELTWYFLVAGLAWLNWQATLTVLVIPYVFVRFLMMAGNWGQHAFIDKSQPENCYVNSITCINTRYNRRCFNDGYHIGHHLKPNRHWTELPVDLIENKSRYAAEGAIVFAGLDFFMIWLLLMLRQYRWLARHYVPLSNSPKTEEEEIVAFLRARTRAICL
jgi:fatty acid desaturase